MIDELHFYKLLNIHALICVIVVSLNPGDVDKELNAN